ncbi:hypothetical protein PMAYCL1PPCAC_14585, partial [Pristionchus mayeri]
DIEADVNFAIPDSSEDEKLSEGERVQREAEDQRRAVSTSIAMLGSCTICHADEVVEPTMCKGCKNIVGCYSCVSRWMRAASERQCPLCRERWPESLDGALIVRLV